MNRDALREVCESSLSLRLSEDQLDAFAAFEEALYAANATRNLTRVPKENCWVRHFVDSLLIAPLLASGAEVLDLGTGPGFPAWPLACARPDLRVTAADSSGKMLDFLRTCPLPNLEIVQARAEEWGVRDRFDVVTGRALAPLAIQLEVSAGPCRLGGRVIPMRTPAEAPFPAAWPELGLELVEVSLATLPEAAGERAVPVYEKRGRTRRGYPRAWMEIRAAPLAGRTVP